MVSVTGVRFFVGSTAWGCCANALPASTRTGTLRTVDFQLRLNIDVLLLMTTPDHRIDDPSLPGTICGRVCSVPPLSRGGTIANRPNHFQCAKAYLPASDRMARAGDIPTIGALR